jgi:hypothetical protein
LQGNISLEAIEHLVDEVGQARMVGTDKKKCGCLLMSTMGLSCACLLAKMINEDKPISLDDIHNHWNRLKFDTAHLCKEEDVDLSLFPEWEVLQVLQINIFMFIW